MPDGSLESAKIDKALDILDGARASQSVVFTWHRATAAETVRRCHDAGITVAPITGNESLAVRAASIEAFQRGELQVLVATIATLGVAANLQCAGQVVFIEESYSAEDNRQARDRVVRQGQTGTVCVHYIRAAGTADEQVLASAVSKSELRRLVLGV